MTSLPLHLPAEYWQNFTVSQRDIEFIHNHLFETETPLSSMELVRVLVHERIRVERDTQSRDEKITGSLYMPAETYAVGQRLIFPALSMKKGEVIQARPGNNPDLGAFQVITVRFEDGSEHLFAGSLPEHKLNTPPEEKPDPTADPDSIMELYGDEIARRLSDALRKDDSLVSIARIWFPSALLIDINVGHLNLSEAILEMNGSEPMLTESLMENIDLPKGINPSLMAFSMNYALHKDERFDEVGPSGVIQWCLKRLEPDEVQNIPAPLKYNRVDYDRSLLNNQMLSLEAQLDDELSETEQRYPKTEEATITLTYPHWRAGTLPVSPRVRHLFPTANESARVRFTLVDGKTGEKLPAWVVREYGYVYGLHKWYEKLKLIPGAYIVLRRSKVPGEVIIEAKSRRPTRDWVRTVLAGSDGGLVFAVLKQEVNCEYNDRMVTFVPDIQAVDSASNHIARGRYSLERLLRNTLTELAKLTPQGHVHAEELYSAVNILFRIPPAPLFAALAASREFTHVGDLHYRVAEAVVEE